VTTEPGSEGLLSGPDPAPTDTEADAPTDTEADAPTDAEADTGIDADPGASLPDAEPGRAGSAPTAESVQALLARAAEGQLEEQREVVSAVTDMRAQLIRLSQELAELRVQQGSGQSSDAQLNSVTVEVREAVRFLNERLDGVTRMVAQRGEELADVRTALTAIDAHVRSQAETIGVLSNGLQVLPSYGERVSILHDNLLQVHRQVEGIEAGLSVLQDDKLGQRLAAVESSVSPMQARLNEIADLETAQSALLSQLQSSASHLQGAVNEMHGRVEAVAEDLAALGGGLAGLANSVESATLAQPELAAGLEDSVARAMDAAEQRLMHHVDEAIYALAQMLLRRLSPDVAPAATDAAGPGAAGVGTASVAELPDEEVLDEADDLAAAPATSATPADDAPEWWEREMHGVAETPAATDDDGSGWPPQSTDEWSQGVAADAGTDVGQLDEDDLDTATGDVADEITDDAADDAASAELGSTAVADVPPEHWTYATEAPAMDDTAIDAAATTDLPATQVPGWWEAGVEAEIPADYGSAGDHSDYAEDLVAAPPVSDEPADTAAAPEADEPEEAAEEAEEEPEPWGTLPPPAERDPAAVTAWAAEEDAPLEAAADDGAPPEPWGTLPPVDRDPADPTVTLEEPEKKHRWWRR
jgi:archaellum component FlaC